jgi:tetratricopeptide (TPR) repeat protein
MELDPENPTGAYRLGIYYRAENQPESAIEYFQKALDINPKLLDAFSQLVAARMAMGESEAALTSCEMQLNVLEGVPAAQAVIKYLEGQIHLSRQSLEDAKSCFQESQRLNENYLPAYYGLANIYIRGGNEDKAMSEIESVIEKNPDTAGPHMLLGVLYDMKDRTDLSEPHYRKALDINPEFTAAANNLAYILAEKEKDLNKALELAQMARENAPEETSIADTLGWVYYKKGLYDSAIEEFAFCLEKQPEHPVMQYHMGLAQYGSGDKQKARQYLEKALELDPDFDGAEEAKRVLEKLAVYGL